jgi:hypothetical protein
MEYLQYIGDLIYNLQIPQYIKYYLYAPDCSSPEALCKSLDPHSQEIVVSYLELEDIMRIYDDSTINYFMSLFNHSLPSLRDANKNGYTHLFKYLVRNGSLVTEYEMVVAIAHGKLDILTHILELGIAPQSSLLEDAVQSGHAHIVEYLIGIGLRPLNSTIDLAIEYGKHEIAEYLKKMLNEYY